jgi:hypothetical protein
LFKAIQITIYKLLDLIEEESLLAET